MTSSIGPRGASGDFYAQGNTPSPKLEVSWDRLIGSLENLSGLPPEEEETGQALLAVLKDPSLDGDTKDLGGLINTLNPEDVSSLGPLLNTLKTLLPGVLSPSGRVSEEEVTEALTHYLHQIPGLSQQGIIVRDQIVGGLEGRGEGQRVGTMGGGLGAVDPKEDKRKEESDKGGHVMRRIARGFLRSCERIIEL